MSSKFYSLIRRAVSLSVFVLTTTVSLSAAADGVIIRTRSVAIHNAETLCRVVSCKKTRFVDADAKEFANGNTFVRLKDGVAGEAVTVVSARQVTADQFLELLILARTAQSEFAQTIKIITIDEAGVKAPIKVVDSKGNLIIDAHLAEKMLKTAGAGRIDSGTLKVPVKTAVTVPHSNSSDKAPLLIAENVDSSLGQLIAQQLGMEFMGRVEVANSSQLQNRQIIFLGTIQEPHNESLLKTLVAVNQMTAADAKVHLITPYLPYARSDKKDQAGVAITGRLIADLIETVGTSSIHFARAHAPQSQGFFRIPTSQSSGRETINKFLQGQGVEQVISPDAGFQKDATLYADDLKVPVSVINKQRDLITGDSKLHDMSGPSVTGKVVAIIDDETASGGTLAKAAEFLKKQGARKVFAVVTHLAGNPAQALNSEHIDKVVVTDSFDVKLQSPKLSVLSLSYEMVKDLRSKLKFTNRCSRAYN